MKKISVVSIILGIIVVSFLSINQFTNNHIDGEVSSDVDTIDSKVDEDQLTPEQMLEKLHAKWLVGNTKIR
ncbi:hypothetical protein [Halalkalibacter nanhaiisediminis]|uniref:Uncharacterized protein n=1 Tax=Halalkalibacter nanhaiisediminis TaxID=688079 RepID=A0A562QPA4_9BACI|nr:hypothetical protein [Halalkalibacter nanhaiisediminis]TWI58030.1 hypothetical protein IQ10_01361 [Halalkalibacter nanhaiisediminis]